MLGPFDAQALAVAEPMLIAVERSWEDKIFACRACRVIVPHEPGRPFLAGRGKVARHGAARSSPVPATSQSTQARSPARRLLPAPSSDL